MLILIQPHLQETGRQAPQAAPQPQPDRINAHPIASTARIPAIQVKSAKRARIP